MCQLVQISCVVLTHFPPCPPCSMHGPSGDGDGTDVTAGSGDAEPAEDAMETGDLASEVTVHLKVPV